MKVTLQSNRLFANLTLMLLFVSSFFLFSCATNSQAEETERERERERLEAEYKTFRETHFEDGSPILTKDTVFEGTDSLLVTFAGDIMAHKPNWARGHYDEIYEDIASELQESDLAFANMETPVCDSRDYSTYPEFNVHHEYVEAAIRAGFNVFSLSNNHTNDQGLTGIKATKAWFDKKRETTKDSERPVYAAGLKQDSDGPLSYEVIEKNGWTILYMAITEILNTPNSSSYIDYIAPSKKARAAFIQEIKQIQEKNPHDLFVLSVHCSEPEYILTVKESQKNYYFELLDAGVDVVWVNHPHVSKYWEIVPDENNVPRKLIFYSMGNTISAQRTNPSWNAPETNRDYTGEGYMAQVRFQKETDGVRIVHLNPILITTYITPNGLYVIKVLNDNLIETLKDESPRWSAYLAERKKLMEKITGKVTWR